MLALCHRSPLCRRAAQEARELACALTVPHLRIPLALAFFAARPGVLLQPALRALLTHVLLTPGPYALEPAAPGPSPSAGADHASDAGSGEREEEAALVVARLGSQLNALGPLGAVPVAPDHRVGCLGHVLGALHLEALHAPGTLIEPLLVLLGTLLSRAADLAATEGRSPHATALLWCVRTAIQVEGALMDALAGDAQAAAAEAGHAYLKRLQDLLRGPVRQYLSRCLSAAERANDIACSAVLHAHLILLWRYAATADLTPPLASLDAVNHEALLDCGLATLLVSGTYVAVWLRTARLRAVAEAEAEFARIKAAAAATQSGGGAAVTAQNTSPFMKRPALPPSYTSPTCDLLSSAPWAAATATTLRHRDALLQWLDDMAATRAFIPERDMHLPGSAADAVLSQCLRVALRRPRVDLLAFEREGGSASTTTHCRVVIESEHPYRPSTDLFKRLQFPGE